MRRALMNFSVEAGFRHLINRNPVNARAFHRYVPAFRFDRPFPELLHFRNQRAEYSRFLFGSLSRLSFHETGRNAVPMNIQSRRRRQNIFL